MMAFSAAALATISTIASVAGTALAVVGTVISVAGIQQQASANEQAARYQAEIAEKNRAQMLENADRTIERSQIEQQDQDQQTLALLAEQEAVQSASGLKLGGRSQMLTRKAARELGRRDALNVRQAGEIEAYNYRILAEDASAQAGFLRMQGQNAQLEGFLASAGTIISGASSVVGSFRPQTSYKGVSVPGTKLNRGLYT